MPIGEWFTRQKPQEPVNPDVKRAVPDGVWEQCQSCNDPMFIKEWERNLRVCPKCEHHSPMPATERIDSLADPNSFEEMWSDICPGDPLNYDAAKSYAETVNRARAKTGLNDAIICGRAKIDGKPVVLAVMDFRFVGGSMGSVVGEKIALSAELAENEQIPLIIVSSSGGARMQEGMLSLMQMAKTSAAIGRLHQANIPYISIMAHPTSGGVTASFATLADIIIAEPNAFIGFTGPRVIEQTIKQRLPKGFQTAESNMEHGMVDMIVGRLELKRTLGRMLYYFDADGAKR